MRIIINILILIMAITIIACEKTQDNTNHVGEMTALEQMKIAFEGGYTTGQIKAVLDNALSIYGVPINEENYSRAGSTLIVLRKENGTNEMDILDYMIRSYVPGVTMKFSDAAAISATFLAAGDK